LICADAEALTEVNRGDVVLACRISIAQVDQIGRRLNLKILDGRRRDGRGG
jgi:hypothetical protein